MGGFGSGRKNQAGKAPTSDHLALDIRRWQREGLLEEGKSFYWSWPLSSGNTASIQVHIGANYARLIYRHCSDKLEWENQNYIVVLNRTPCNFGGSRLWFLCPFPGCSRRVAILYHGSVFACRKCHELVYKSQREAGGERAMRMAERIRKRLGWQEGILTLPGIKPKGMHKNTFKRLQARHDVLVYTVLYYAKKEFGMELDIL